MTQDDGLVVITAMEMPDWEVRPHRSTLIRFEDQTWRISARTVAAGKVHYHLTRWDVADHERAGREVDYNTEYVTLRDQAAPKARRHSRATGFFRYASPLIGFLPARTKAQLESSHGIDPVACTFHSVFVEFLIAVNALALAAIGMGAWMQGYSPAATGLPIDLFLVVAVIVGIDGSTRYGRILREERPPPGFYEWLIRRRRGVN